MIGKNCSNNNSRGQCWKYTYDYAGNITSTTDANGGTIEYFYNSLGQVCEIKDQEGNSEYFYYDSEGNLTKHIDRNQNHVDRKYNIDRNIVDLKAYQLDKEAIALEKKESEEEAKKLEKEKIKSLNTSPGRNRFTERMKRKKSQQELEKQNSNCEMKDSEDFSKNKLNVISQRFKYNSDGTLKNAYTGNMQYEYTYNIEGLLESKSASGRTLLRYTYDKIIISKLLKILQARAVFIVMMKKIEWS